MKAIKKRFWIFEAGVILYSLFLLLILDIMFGYNGFELRMIVVKIIFSLVCLMSGLITWLMMEGKHWILFAIIYDVILLSFFTLISWIILFADIPFDKWFVKETYIGINEFYFVILMIGVCLIIPTLALSFFGYNIFRYIIPDKEIQ